LRGESTLNAHAAESKLRRRLADLAMTKNDRGCSQNRAADNEREIGQKQGQQHQGETAKHRCPIFHPFAVGEDDEAEGAENNAGDTVHCEQVGHMPFL